jgi:hypothetical protein
MVGSLAVVLIYLIGLVIAFCVIRLGVRHGVDDALQKNREWLGRDEERRPAPER